MGRWAILPRLFLLGMVLFALAVWSSANRWGRMITEWQADLTRTTDPTQRMDIQMSILASSIAQTNTYLSVIGLLLLGVALFLLLRTDQ